MQLNTDISSLCVQGVKTVSGSYRCLDCLDTENYFSMLKADGFECCLYCDVPVCAYEMLPDNKSDKPKAVPASNDPEDISADWDHFRTISREMFAPVKAQPEPEPQQVSELEDNLRYAAECEEAGEPLAPFERELLGLPSVPVSEPEPALSKRLQLPFTMNELVAIELALEAYIERDQEIIDGYDDQTSALDYKTVQIIFEGQMAARSAHAKLSTAD
jgi:hypothetical protein